MGSGYGVIHFLGQSDAVGRGVLAILLGLSVASWYLILVKLLQNALDARAVRAFLAGYRASGTLAELADRVHAQSDACAHARLARDGIAAAEHCRRHAASRLTDTGTGEIVSRALRQRLQHESARRERGLTLLAATASSAPFIGLFGTVWGIYQALINIGMSGQGTLDKVAGPVGEALVMTAGGLAVAIPAVLAYNFFVRANRSYAGDLAAFSNALFTLLATGAKLDEPDERGAAAPAPAGAVPAVERRG